MKNYDKQNHIIEREFVCGCTLIFTIQRDFNPYKIYQSGGTDKDHLGDRAQETHITNISKSASAATSIANEECQCNHQQHHNKNYEYFICSSVIYFVDSAFVQGYTLFCKHFIAFFGCYFNDWFNDR